MRIYNVISIFIISGMIKNIYTILIVFILFLTGAVLPVGAGAVERTNIIVFVRDDCGNCAREEKYLSNSQISDNFDVELLNIADAENKKLFQLITQKYGLSKVTPITLVGGEVLVGFNEKVTGKKILSHIDGGKYEIDYYISNEAETESGANNYSCSVETASTCSLEEQETNSMMTLPFFGEVDIKETSLILLSSVLGFIDGFNPCAMWVLLTFLIILSQIGDKKKMIYLVSVFVLAEAIMYFLILNIWYQTWDFIALDKWVTPGVGFLAVGAGGYFLYKWYKSGEELTCDVTSFEHQQKTTQKIQDIVKKPITIITTLVVLGIAFSVNIIEFACSVGIAQSFTKILELNDLSFFARQFQIFIYTLFYMADDFLIFGLAIAGFEKFHTVGAKYSKLSTLIGGVLMLILGVMLIFNPKLLMF